MGLKRPLAWIVLWLILASGCRPIKGVDIYCPHCKRHLYTYQKEEIKADTILRAKDFKPVWGVPQPRENTEMVCPFDKAPLNGWEYYFWKRQYPMPRLIYPALSLLTKGQDFYYVPYDVNIQEK